MTDTFYDTLISNKNNYLTLAKEYDFNEFDSDYIHRTFSPILDIKTYNDSELIDFLAKYKDEFIQRHDFFDLTIFKRTELDLLEWDLNQHLDCLEKGKYTIWDNTKGKYFYHLKIKGETANSQTLLISDKNEIQLEIYFKSILKIILKFTKENDKFAETVMNIELMGLQAIDKAIERITEKLTEKIKLQETIEEKIFFCKNQIKSIKQLKDTQTPLELNYNTNYNFLDYASINFPDQTKTLVNWLKTEIKYLKNELNLNINKKVNLKMEQESLLDELLFFANRVCDIQIKKLGIANILHFDSEDFLQEEFLDEHNYLLQKNLIEASEKQIVMLLKNLSKAIATNCNNNIDLSTVSITNDFGYTLRVPRDSREKKISKRYGDYKLTPKNESLFKREWLKRFVKDIKNIKTNIENILELPQPKDSIVLNKKNIEPSKLIDLFEHTSKYKHTMNILVSEKLIHEITYLWIDEKKGNKSFLVAIIKDLYHKKFFKENSKPSHLQIQKICLNTFGMKISIDTIKKAINSSFDLNFIPVATTLNITPNT